MMDMLQANWMAAVVVAGLVLLVAVWLLRRATKAPPRRDYKPDVLDEGAAPAQRNQALIDAPPAAQIITPPPFTGVMAGVGEVIAVTAQDEVEELEARAAAMEVVPEVEEVPEVEPESKPESKPEPESEVVVAPEPPPGLIAAPQPEPAPAPVPAVVPAPATGDDLSKIKGLGPKLQALLPQLGITTYAQIAALSEGDLAALDSQLGPFAGRPAKDNWVEQASYLAAGDLAGFEGRFGKV